MSALAWIGFLAAGAAGAPARFLVDTWVQERSEGVFPRGTLAVNVAGSLLLGLLTGLGLYHGLGQVPRTILGTGFCGAFTTFSTFTYETVRLAEAGDLAEAGRNLLATLATGAVAAAAGLAAAAAIP